MTHSRLLLLDVDGPLNPYEAKPHRRPAGYTTHRITPAGFDPRRPLRVWLNPDHGPMLLDLARHANLELVWATTWQHQANEFIGPRIGLPELPVIEFGNLNTPAWKFTGVAEFVGTSDFVWLDDDFDLGDPGQRADLIDITPGNKLLRYVDPRVGITPADLDAVRTTVRDWTRKDIP